MKVPYNNLDMQMQKSFLIVFILIVTNTANLAAKSSPWDIADKIVAELNPVFIQVVQFPLRVIFRAKRCMVEPYPGQKKK